MKRAAPTRTEPAVAASANGPLSSAAIDCWCCCCWLYRLLFSFCRSRSPMVLTSKLLCVSVWSAKCHLLLWSRERPLRPLCSPHSLSLSFSLKKNRLYSLHTQTMSLYPIIFSPSNQAHNRYDVARSSKFIIVLCVSPLSCSAAKVAKPFGTGEEEECVRFVACMELHSTGLVVGTCAAYRLLRIHKAITIPRTRSLSLSLSLCSTIIKKERKTEKGETQLSLSLSIHLIVNGSRERKRMRWEKKGRGADHSAKVWCDRSLLSGLATS